MRLQWANVHRSWRSDWQQVVFSDESRFNLWHHNGRIRVRRYAGERHIPECIIERHSRRTPGVMVWGAIAYHGRSQLLRIVGRAIRGFSSGRPRGITPADDRYIVLQARRNRRQTAGEIARHTTQATGRPISRFTVARRLHGGGLFARRPVRCVPLTPANRRRRFLWCREHRNWRDNEWGRVLFTDESRFSLSSDYDRILIWRERGSRNHPSNIIERDRYGGRCVLVWGVIMLGSRTELHIFDAGSVNGTRYCNEILLPYVRLFRGAMGLQFLFMDDNAPCHRTVAAEQLLESRRLAARTLPPVTILELRLALQDEWAAMPQQLIDTLILSMGRRCETCLADEVEKLAYQLNEEAERTESPIRRLRRAIRGFSSGRPRGITPADDRYIVLQARRNRRQTAGEIARHTTQATGRPISRFTVARRLHGGGLFARRPVRCVPLTPANRRRRFLWCREHRNWRDNEWGRVLFTDESRFSLSSDYDRILIWRERGSRNHPSNIIERDRYGGRCVLVWGVIMLGSRTNLHIFDAGSVNGTRYCNEILLPYVRLFRGAMGLQFLFLDDNAPCHRTVAAEQLLESEDIERMDWPARSPDLNPNEHVWDFLGRRLAARTLPPVTIRGLRLALQDEWAAMSQQLIDTLILSMGRRCETCLAVRGDHIPY
ncbi:transposable element Tcb2 transposase [Trichonephila clavipes]|nr:transposable element Tcb2 transposase [Trichonephila clavipes]